MAAQVRVMIQMGTLSQAPDVEIDLSESVQTVEFGDNTDAEEMARILKSMGVLVEQTITRMTGEALDKAQTQTQQHFENSVRWMEEHHDG